MQPISSLINKLQKDFPALTFTSGGEFRWSPDEQTIFYDPVSGDSAALLHELSHATLEHTAYSRDVELIELERAAWQYAREHLAQTYGVAITTDQIEDSLDTYRDWLHSRSSCPACGALGLQVRTNEYKCLACSQKWRVNDGRVCALRRYKVKAN